MALHGLQNVAVNYKFLKIVKALKVLKSLSFKCAFATMHTIKGGGNRFEQRQRLNRGQFISRLLITSVCPPPGFTESPYDCFLFKTQQHGRVHHLKTCSTLSKNEQNQLKSLMRSLTIIIFS